MTIQTLRSIAQITAPLFKKGESLNNICTALMSAQIKGVLKVALPFDKVSNAVKQEAKTKGYLKNQEEIDALCFTRIESLQNSNYDEIHHVAEEFANTGYNPTEDYLKSFRDNWMGSFPKKIKTKFDGATIMGQVCNILLEDTRVSYSDLWDKLDSLLDSRGHEVSERQKIKYYKDLKKMISFSQELLEVMGEEELKTLFK